MREWRKEMFAPSTTSVIFIYNLHSRLTFSILEELVGTVGVSSLLKGKPGLLLGCKLPEPSPRRYVTKVEGEKLAALLGIKFREVVLDSVFGTQLSEIGRELRDDGLWIGTTVPAGVLVDDVAKEGRVEKPGSRWVEHLGGGKEKEVKDTQKENEAMLA
jgi:hypothetical protein